MLTKRLLRKLGPIQHPNERDRKRIERGLISRKHYRYVSPSVTLLKVGYLIESCHRSRTIDYDGGQIDVAIFHYDVVSGVWKVFFKDHAREKLENLRNFPPAGLGDQRTEHGSRAAVLAVMLI
ncbi:hypothetical protein ACVWWG_001900 [Bradyrhizobium sp. LB7.2]